MFRPAIEQEATGVRIVLAKGLKRPQVGGPHFGGIFDLKGVDAGLAVNDEIATGILL